jgi:hypothetical protein
MPVAGFSASTRALPLNLRCDHLTDVTQQAAADQTWNHRDTVLKVKQEVELEKANWDQSRAV